jgi:hypothetical protein
MLRFAAVARAQGSKPKPKRLILFYTPHGTIPDNFFPVGDETNFTLGSILSPLEAHKKDLLIFDGLDIKAKAGNGHPSATGCIFTGVALASVVPAVSRGPSIDQRLAHEFGSATPFGAVQLGVNSAGRDGSECRSIYSMKGKSLPNEDDPVNAYARLFGGSGGGAGAPVGAADPLDPLRGLVRRHVLEDTQTLKMSSGAEARARLGVLTDTLADIERRLTKPPGTTTVPAQGTSVACGGPGPVAMAIKNDTMPAVGQAQMDIAVAALACERTRFVSLQWTHEVHNQTFPWLGLSAAFSGGHHTMSHSQNFGGLTKINTWYAEQLAYLVAKLKAIPDGGGSLFDSTIVMWGNGLGMGQTHYQTRLPVLLAGGGGAFRTGRMLKFVGGRPVADLLTSLLQAFGINEVIGDPATGAGPLPGLI